MVKFDGELFEVCKKEPAGVGFYVFVAYVAMVHIALAYAAKTHYDRWVAKQAVDLGFITTTIDELKVECKRRGLQVGGKKCELLNRLVAVPGCAKRSELLQLEDLHNEFKAVGMVVHLSDVLAASETDMLIMRWRQYKLD